MGEERRWVVRALMPLLIRPHPIIQGPQLLYPMVDAVDMSGPALVMTTGAISLASTERFREPPPHPQQGGSQITAQYLRGLQDTEAQWAFRYVHQI